MQPVVTGKSAALKSIRSDDLRKPLLRNFFMATPINSQTFDRRHAGSTSMKVKDFVRHHNVETIFAKCVFY